MSGKIYTKKGDGGKTSIMGTTKRFFKSETRLEAIGTIDELNCYIGLIRSDYNTDQLEKIQDELFCIGASLAQIDQSDPNVDVSALEKDMDLMNEELPPLKNFILPAGVQIVCYSHISRAVCRRGERILVKLYQEEDISPLILKYINRLSDYLFVLARCICFELGYEETIWKS